MIEGKRGKKRRENNGKRGYNVTRVKEKGRKMNGKKDNGEKRDVNDEKMNNREKEK